MFICCTALPKRAACHNPHTLPSLCYCSFPSVLHTVAFVLAFLPCLEELLALFACSFPTTFCIFENEATLTGIRTSCTHTHCTFLPAHTTHLCWMVWAWWTGHCLLPACLTVHHLTSLRSPVPTPQIPEKAGLPAATSLDG